MLNTDKIAYIAKLSHLELSQEEIQTYADQLSLILDYMSELNKLDTDSVSDTIGSIVNLDSVVRPDIIVETQNDIISNILQQAPHTENNQIKVKNVF